MARHSNRLLTDALAQALTDAGLLVDVGIKPDGGGWQGSPGASTFEPYTVLYPSIGGASDGPICDPFTDVAADFIITSFGATPTQAMWGADEAREALTSPGTIVVVGRVVMLAIPDVEGGVIRDDDVQPPIYSSPCRWRLMTTAAA